MEEDSGPSPLKSIQSFLWRLFRPHKGEDLAGEIHDLMNEGQAMGLITGEESEMVHGVLDLKETPAHSIMIPRTAIISASIDSTLQEIIELVQECGHTRIPIYRDSIDEILGVLHSKDLLKFWGKDPGTRIPPEIIRKTYFVPPNKKVSDLLREMKERKTHLAIVTDEYGGTAGIITIEDILEEIVGEIQDEHDTESPFITEVDENSIVVDARLEVEKLEDHFGVRIPRGEYESVGGFMIHRIGRIPKAGEKVLNAGLELTVRSASARKIDEILVRRLAPSSSGEPETP
ncbi:MAG: hemolysin family protein [Thermodesulfobacteriota bacterium]